MFMEFILPNYFLQIKTISFKAWGFGVLGFWGDSKNVGILGISKMRDAILGGKESSSSVDSH